MQITTLWALGSAGATLSEKGKKTLWLREREPPNMENINRWVNFILVVAVLVATVTFAAGLTVPGGFNSSDNGPTSEGLATLGNKGAFQLFIVCDSMAMYCSMTGAFLLIWSLLARDVAKSANSWALKLVGAAIFAMSVAFMSATYLVVSNISWVAYLILVMAILYLFCFVVFLIALFLPFGIHHPIFHCLCQVVIPSMVFFTQPFNKKVDGREQESFPVEKDKHEESQPSNKDRRGISTEERLAHFKYTGCLWI